MSYSYPFVKYTRKISRDVGADPVIITPLQANTGYQMIITNCIISNMTTEVITGELNVLTQETIRKTYTATQLATKIVQEEITDGRAQQIDDYTYDLTKIEKMALKTDCTVGNSGSLLVDVLTNFLVQPNEFLTFNTHVDKWRCHVHCSVILFVPPQGHT